MRISKTEAIENSKQAKPSKFILQMLTTVAYSSIRHKSKKGELFTEIMLTKEEAEYATALAFILKLDGFTVEIGSQYDRTSLRVSWN